MNIDRLEGNNVVSSLIELSATEYNGKENITTELKLSFDKFMDDGKEKYMFCLYAPKEYLSYKLVERGQLDFNCFSRNEAIELWKAMGSIIKEDIK